MKIPLDKVKNQKLTGQEDEYIVIDKIDKGGGGNVFACVDSEEKIFAVKIFSRFIDDQTSKIVIRFKTIYNLDHKFQSKNKCKIRANKQF